MTPNWREWMNRPIGGLDRWRTRSHVGGDRQPFTIRVGGKRSAVRIVGTRRWRLITTPLLRGEEFTLHAFEELPLRIAGEVKAGHGSGTEGGFVGRADLVASGGSVGRLLLPQISFAAWRVDNVQPRRFTNRAARAGAEQF